MCLTQSKTHMCPHYNGAYYAAPSCSGAPLGPLGTTPGDICQRALHAEHPLTLNFSASWTW